MQAIVLKKAVAQPKKKWWWLAAVLTDVHMQFPQKSPPDVVGSIYGVIGQQQMRSKDLMKEFSSYFYFRKILPTSRI